MNYPSDPVIGWFSGGVTNAVACKLAIDLFGEKHCRMIFIDTMNEDPDSYRFLKDCEKWYNVPIETIQSEHYDSIQQVWKRFKGLNFAHGAICSAELKRRVRIKWQSENKFSFQVFGYDIREPRRAEAFTKNYGETNPIYPLLLFGWDKNKCIQYLHGQGIAVPKAYEYGFNNNNCLRTGCVQGGIGYWQLMQKKFPGKFSRMAAMEHELTALRGAPVTMLKDQSKAAKESGNQLVFLKPHPDYPKIKDLSVMKGRQPKPLIDCNGFCGTNDLKRNPTEEELNFEKR